MEYIAYIKELLTPKVFSKLSFLASIFWIVLGSILLGFFGNMEKIKSTSDFDCQGQLFNKHLIQGKCSDQYEEQYNKLSIPVYLFVIFNFLVVAAVFGLYSISVRSRVNKLGAHDQRLGTHEPLLDPKPTKRLFIAYCCQLTVRFALCILAIVVQTQVLYPNNFPSDFRCTLIREENATKALAYECHYDRGREKTSWSIALAVVNGIFALIALMEILWILYLSLKAKTEETFMEDSQFVSNYLKFHIVSQSEVDGQNIIQLENHHRNDNDILLVLNNGKEKDLTKLFGVGPKHAQRILDGRRERQEEGQGEFKTVKDLEHIGFSNREILKILKKNLYFRWT